ncbi:MAG: zeta toxin family protein [Bacteroidia bacterium]
MPWICETCGDEIWSDENMVMLKNNLWLSIAKKEEVLCDLCIEKRLGRSLQLQDLLPDAICNKWYLKTHNLYNNPNRIVESLVDKILLEAKQTLNEYKVISFPKKNDNLVIMMGSPGAGKSFVIDNIVNLPNYKLLNSDKTLEYFAKKRNLSTKDSEIVSDLHKELSPKTKTFRDKFISHQKGKTELPNIIIDITGGNIETLQKLNKLGKEVGYTTTLIYVITTLENALIRNSVRERTVPEEIVYKTYKEVQDTYYKTFQIFDAVYIKNNDNTYIISTKDGKFIRPHDEIIRVK